MLAGLEHQNETCIQNNDTQITSRTKAEEGWNRVFQSVRPKQEDGFFARSVQSGGTTSRTMVLNENLAGQKHS